MSEQIKTETLNNSPSPVPTISGGEGSNFLITGGAGFIGSHIAEYLLKNGAKKVRVLDNMANGFKTNLAVLQLAYKLVMASTILVIKRHWEVCLEA
jgi:FlaA1/EpsC-like NDP-sugar epimerase